MSFSLFSPDREAVSFAVKNNMWNKLVPYVIPPVLKQVGRRSLKALTFAP